MAPAHLVTRSPQPTPADGVEAKPTDSTNAQWERPSCYDNGQLDLVIDVQLFQLTLKAASPQALPAHVRRASSVSKEDIKDVFGDVALQASLTTKYSLLEIYKVKKQ